MGQSSSRSRPRSVKPAVISPLPSDSDRPEDITSDTDDAISGNDYTLNLPEECLACIFQSLSSADRNRSFGAKGMNALLNNCESLEELSVKRLTGGVGTEPIGPGKAAGALKVICLKDLYNGQCFEPLIIGSNNLRSLKLFRCPADWDSLLVVIANRITGLVELHLEKLQVSDLGLSAISNCVNLEILHLVKIPAGTNAGLMAVAEKCKLIRKLHIDGWKTNRISDDGLIAVATHCPSLQELVLIGVNPTKLSLEKLAIHCQNLERLALCGSDTVGDAEMWCIAAKCTALKKLCIKSCPVSDHGIEAFAGGCPNLVKVKFKKCIGVTSEGADWLRASRGSLAVNLDAMEPEIQDACASEQEASGIGIPQTDDQTRGINTAASNSGMQMSFKVRLGLLRGRSLVASKLRRWSSFGGSSRNNLGRT
ncbi:unnamed protein product [Fraxinus pennsylvanica]|uniref:F-box protein n=1 Tax=Fraxinus pennsylvanica TaxID=56036 RepID=A0AAD2E7L4_9LAMI|nr:unnamed protein product [Fraxinus pennsylvanica]